MMFSLAVFASASVLSVPAAAATDGFLWSSFAYIRAGDRTPAVGNQSTTLTSLGAQQLFSLGSFFRSRYIDGQGLAGLNPTVADDAQVYALALDEQYTVASAQAFMQGLYPPNATDGSTLANGTTINSPLGGINFAHVSTARDGDANMIYVAGSNDCPALEYYTQNGIDIPSFVSTETATQSMYDSLSYLLDEVMDRSQQNYFNAWTIYDYINHLYTYNSTVAAQLDKLNVMSQLRTLADSQQTAYLGNLNSTNVYNRLPEKASVGGISTIAGASTASLVLQALTQSAQRSQDSYQLSLMFGDFDPMLSLFALLGLSQNNADFTGLPAYGSALVFELYSTSDPESGIMPTVSDLTVRFSFRNGTEAELQQFGIFGTSGGADMAYTDFVAAMNKIAITGPADWCSQCGSANIMCAPYNVSDTAFASSAADPQAHTVHRKGHSLSNIVAGAIGGVLGLLVAGLLASGLAVLCGFRVHRTGTGPAGSMFRPVATPAPTGWRVRSNSGESRSSGGTSASRPILTRQISRASSRGSSTRQMSPISEKRPVSSLYEFETEEARYKDMGHDMPRRPRRASPNARFPVRGANSPELGRHGRFYPVGGWSNYSE